MSQIPQEVALGLGDRSYRILIGGGLLANPVSYDGLPRANAALIVSNTPVVPLHASALRVSLAGHFAHI